MRKKNLPKQVFTILDEMAASPVKPMTARQRMEHIDHIKEALDALMSDPNPRILHVVIVGDCMNMLDAIAGMKFNQRGSEYESIDYPEEKRAACVDAVVRCVERHKKTGVYRLDGPGLTLIQEAVEFYETLLEVIPARVFVKAHRQNARDTNIKTPKGHEHGIFTVVSA